MGTKANVKKITPFEKELIETIKQVNQYKEADEANIVAILYKNSDLI